jgi:hypothetical protein
MSTSPGSLPALFWQHYDNAGTPVDATTGSYAQHYRYALPKVLSDNWSAASTLPAGFIYLWDHSQTGTLIEGLVFTAENAVAPSTYILIASGAALDTWITSYMDTAYSACGGSAALTQRDNHDPTYYPANGLRVVTVGNPLSANLSQTTKTLLDHDHGSANSQPGKPVDHGSLTSNFHDDDDYSGIVFYPSTILNDWHPQYLHRGGYGGRDSYGNGMLGNLLMNSSNSASNYQNISADSRSILFGHPTTGPQLGFRSSTRNLDVVGSGLGVSANSTYFSVEINASGYAALLTDNAALFVNPNTPQLRLGSYSTGDYIAWLSSTYIGMVVGDTNILLARKSGSYKALDIGSTMRLTDTGSVLAVEDQTTTIGDEQDGQISVNRIWGGEHDDTTSPGVYRLQGGNWGPVRRYVMSPSDFAVYDHISYNDATPLPETSHTNTVVGYDGDAGSTEPKRATSLYVNDNGNDTLALGYIKLPFAYYGIVNVLFSMKPESNLAAGQGHVTLGYSLFDAARVAPGGTSAIQADFAVCSGVVTGAGTAGVWQYNSGSLIRAFNIDTAAARVEVNNRHDTSLPKQPWVRFYIISSGSNDFEFSDITILYRIKEW